ncbi:MAG: peptidoglycan-binding domain-containing protein [Pyrinomonadaceae bacterium]
MKKLIFIVLAILSLSVFVNAQATPTPTPTATPQKVKKPIFRSTKDQIMQVQKMLKEKGLYKGEATGKMEDDFRVSIKSYQKDNGLKQTGTLNRATLEKMGVVLTDKQMEIPVDPNSFDTGDASKTSSTTKKAPVFRATKEQIMEAQKILKDKAMYGGEQTGKLDDATRDGLKKYQEANGLKVTGTLNQVTLEKMGVVLTDKQKENAAKNPK